MCGYETVSTCIHSGAIALSKLGIPPGHHTLDIIAVGLVTGLLDRLPSRGEYKKVIRCDTCINFIIVQLGHTLNLKFFKVGTQGKCFPCFLKCGKCLSRVVNDS